MDILPRFIIIDDDELNNKICTISLEKVSKHADIKSFTDSVAGFEYIAREYSETNYAAPTVLLLDLTMPGMDGWEFLKRFGKLDTAIKRQIKIYILSSSEDQRDMEKAIADEHVTRYLIKPLNKESLKIITGN
jgi:two-component system, chemotaxis family, chemotaxis protein CheY